MECLVIIARTVGYDVKVDQRFLPIISGYVVVNLRRDYDYSV